jgi:hypothetical protein
LAVKALLLGLLLAVARAGQDPPPTPAAQKPIDLARCEAFSAALQSALENNNLDELQACIDDEALLEKSTAGIECEPDFRKGFIQGSRETLLPAFLRSIHEGLEKQATLRLLRIRVLEGRPRPLLRFLHSDGGFEYLEFELRDGPDGKLRAVDWHGFATGEWVSETLHHVYLPLALQSQHGLLDRLLGRDELLARHWKKVARLVDCVVAAKLDEGLEVYAGLPEELRHDKFVLLQRLHLLVNHVEHEDYLRVLADLRRYCPGDPANEVHAIDYYFLRKEWKQAAAAVRSLRDLVDGDPNLDSMEATVLLQVPDLVSARAAIERSVAGEPEREQSHWILMNVCLKQRDYAAVLAELKRIDERFKVEWNDLTEVPEYKEFATSPQHAEWLKYRASRK